MPELPEVETVRRGLHAALTGRRVVGVEIGRQRTVRRTSARAVIDGLTGATFLVPQRRGKYLVLPLDTGNAVMIHLRMSGQVRVVAGGLERPLHTHVVAALDDGGELWFVDPRTFGEVVVFDPARLEHEIPELARLGPEPTDLGLSEFRARLRASSRQLKALLLDQSVVAGIGNIYADEILHRARLRPQRPSNSLSSTAERRLHHAIGEVIAHAIVSGGSTLGDAQYVDVDGAAGTFQHQHRVYARGGERCLTCGRGWIRRVTVSQRSTHFCAVCQF